MSDQGNGQWPQQPDPENGQNGPTHQQDSGQHTGGHRLPGGNTGAQGGHAGGQQAPGGDTGGQWPGGQQPWTGGEQQWSGGQQPWTGGEQQWNGGQQQWTGGQPPWASGGQGAQPPSWSTGQTGPNVGPTMNNQQSSYYDRFSEASGEGLKVPQGGGGGGRGKVLIGLAAALVVIVAAVAIFAFTRGDDSPTEAGGSSSTSALPPVRATTWTNPTLAVGARALKAGWQSQQATDGRGVYDVPKTADWKLESSDTLFGYADPKSGKPLVVSKAPAQYGVGYCAAKKTAESAWVGLMNVGKRDPSDAGPDVAQRFADAIAQKKDGSKAKQGKLSAAKQIKVNQGTIPALEYTITTAVGDPDSCDKGKTYEIRTVTFSSGGRSYQMVSVRVTDGPKTLPTKTLDEVFTTFRPSN
ncbi:MAG TPA: hypothetical protein VG502_21585 [Flexivirga sp.]|uniref:hypothetical protein n=1 Tax=Flexivirga sp. TaxID=1962927 RepID=UPI002C2DA8AC|nr:hypothetical protein [Flexivirga sp.]HWC24900.1 hypothetical protein [Flexivirga sp.]